jgi:TFIIF-interacting CTD phosphatase-like protein
MTVKIKNKPNIFLDLDQTIISAEDLSEFNPKKHKSRMKKFKYYYMDNDYVIFERPGLQIFLDYLFANFNVSVWTAASKDYALFIIENIVLAKNKNRKIDYIFFSYHCDLSKDYKNHTKDLRLLWKVYKFNKFNKYNTLIIDDYDEVYETQPNNCIIAKPFEFLDKESEKDRFLLDLIYELEFLRHRLNNNDKDLAKTLNKKLKIKLK